MQESQLRELSRRSGYDLRWFKEALGNADRYRLHQGLLQRNEFVPPTGQHEWMTVVPDGPWRTYEFAGQPRKLTSRKYVTLNFHNTPTS